MREWWKGFIKKLKRDTWSDPTIGITAAILVTGLTLLIGWLTATYAPDSIERSRSTVGAGDDVISVEFGYLTLALVVCLTLLAGFEPIVTRRIDRWWLRYGRHWFSRRPAAFQIAARSVAAALYLVPKFLSVALSLLDVLLARGVATVAGAGWKSWRRRYAQFFCIIGGAVALGLVAPANIATPAIVTAIVAVVGVVRRWSWIELDRDTFLVERGERLRDASALRVGFAQDLRDEAMVALACLFALIPFALDQLQIASCASEQGCAFAVDQDGSTKSATWQRFPIWLGYFGAELAKTVPFVDWSEVFHVANGSPLRPNTALGSQATFVLRAGLDLLFLAAVLQSVQIATRLREQKRAFEANRLPILEPFSEALEFKRAASQVVYELDDAPTDQPVVETFPQYDQRRLTEMVAEGVEEFRSSSRDGGSSKPLPMFVMASALLARQHPGPKTDAFLSRMMANPSEHDQSWLGRVALHSSTSLVVADQRQRRRQLFKVVGDSGERPDIRAAAVRALGRLRLDSAEGDLLQRIVRRDVDQQLTQVRADSAVALAKSGLIDRKDIFQIASDVPPSLSRSLIGDDNNDRRHQRALADAMPVLCLAFALSISSERSSADGVEDIVSGFDPALRRIPTTRGDAPVLLGDAIVAACKLELSPLSIHEAKLTKRGDRFNQLVQLRPGMEPHESHFFMGSSEAGHFSYVSERPRRDVIMREFCIGRFPVTQSEYVPFLGLLGREPGQNKLSEDKPAVRLTWHDATRYCWLLRRITGEHYRLPSEAEWEYACRAGTDTMFSWGDDWDVARANSNLSPYNGLTGVMHFPPNNWGLWGMLGNVYEWCADPWHPNYEGAPRDQRPWTEFGDFELRVIRGGSWSSGQQNMRCADRNRVAALHADAYVGFRLARDI